jgi:hypothetical protein
MRKLKAETFNDDPEGQTLQAKFIDGLGHTLSTAVSALRPVVLRLIDFGATRAHLINLAVDAGYKKAYVRTLLSEILVRNNCRERKPGAGPKTFQLALLMLAFAREKAGTQAHKLLKAAHAAKIEDEAELSVGQSHFQGPAFGRPYLI